MYEPPAPQDPHQPLGPPPSQPYPPVPPRKSHRTLWIVLGSIAGVLVLCCVGALILGAVLLAPKTRPAGAAASVAVRAPLPPSPSVHLTPPSPTTAKTTPPPAPTTAAASVDPGREICSFVEGGGTYYRLVTSETDYNMSACVGGTRYTGTLEDLFTIPGMDRRCILGDAGMATFDAIVGVYSDTKKADLVAARAFCQQYGGSNA
jgi:hypothetical protein